MPDSGIGFVFAALAALCVGVSKTGMPAVGILFIPLMVQAFPAKESVGALLPLLIMGDCLAVYYYRRSANMKLFLSLIPWLAVGIGLGSYFLSRLTNLTIRPVLGVIILLLILLDLLRHRPMLKEFSGSIFLAAFAGITAGCTTTIGNAAGPVVSIYFLILGLEKREFMGTAAWLFLLVNCSKFPIFVSMDLIRLKTLGFAVLMFPFILIGAFSGRKLLLWLPQKAFNLLITLISGLVAVSFLWGYFVSP